MAEVYQGNTTEELEVNIIGQCVKNGVQFDSVCMELHSQRQLPSVTGASRHRSKAGGIASPSLFRKCGESWLSARRRGRFAARMQPSSMLVLFRASGYPSLPLFLTTVNFGPTFHPSLFPATLWSDLCTVCSVSPSTCFLMENSL